MARKSRYQGYVKALENLSKEEKSKRPPAKESVVSRLNRLKSKEKEA